MAGRPHVTYQISSPSQRSELLLSASLSALFCLNKTDTTRLTPICQPSTPGDVPLLSPFFVAMFVFAPKFDSFALVLVRDAQY